MGSASALARLQLSSASTPPETHSPSSSLFRAGGTGKKHPCGGLALTARRTTPWNGPGHATAIHSYPAGAVTYGVTAGSADGDGPTTTAPAAAPRAVAVRTRPAGAP